MRSSSLCEVQQNMGERLGSVRVAYKLGLLWLYVAVTVAKQFGTPRRSPPDLSGGDVTGGRPVAGARRQNAQKFATHRLLKPPDIELSRNMAQLDSSKILEILARRKRSDDTGWNPLPTDQGDHNNNGPFSETTVDIPNEYTVYIRLGDGSEVNNPAVQEQVQQRLADTLHIPTNNVHLTQLKPEENMLSYYFVKAGHRLRDSGDLIGAEQVQLDIAQNPPIIPSLTIRDVFTQDEISLAASNGGDEEGVSLATFMPYIIAGVAVFALTFIVVGVWCYVRAHRMKSNIYSGHSSPSPPAHVPRQICLYPEAKPCTNHATLIQPDASQLNSSPVCSECVTPVHTPPLRIKKGLLERRGSNASLTLDLAPQGPDAKPAWGSPPRESSSEEYLTSAGNRMSRKQLRSCLKNNKLLHEEFWEIPMNHPDRIEVPGSGVKNRYRTIIPNAKTRVCLPEVDDEPLTTYINANYIKGYAGEPEAFIATQGPMTHTVEDFWRMVWLEKVPIIIMITKLKEKNKTKCECYLPERENTYGAIHIRIVQITEREGYILRQLILKCGEEQHTVLHYWYTAWPDHKAPDTARQLLSLVKEVEKQRWDPITKTRRKPVVVHCSAGIGRTGCFIATSIGMQQLKEEHMVDILGIVCNMRLARGGMVQTNEQYVFVHQALCLYEKELPPKPPAGD